ncbi:hypothetical protein BDZ91DRAFT_235075 [Kalaharituber pfeilii]|nr:hypothetical protein BDZ91DRAFT_235075 [Kalaharituber pfeilii]
MQSFLRTVLLKRGPGLMARSRPIGRRTYATHVEANKSSDLPWIVGSLAVTVPAVLYLMSGPTPHKPDVHKAAYNAASKAQAAVPYSVAEAKQTVSGAASTASEAASKVTQAAKEKYEEASPAVSSTEDTEEKAGDAYESAEETAQDTAEETAEGAVEETSQDTANEDTAREATEQMKEETPEMWDKVKASAENAVPKPERTPRLQTEAERLAENKKPAKRDLTHTDMGPSAATRETKSMNEMSGKQEGITSGPTWHAEFYDGKGPGISKKSEGVHDSVKLKGTVDPGRVPK